jgi:RNA polymerase sigma-70 factor (ECF subfamily)
LANDERGIETVQSQAQASTTYQGIRPYLFAVAYRLTGSASDAEDLVHDAWVRYLDAGSPAVESIRAYLTTIVSRLSLDYLKSARVKREQYVGPWLPEPLLTPDPEPGPDEQAERRESVSMAILTVLDRLPPDQRVVYVLRESFDIPYDEIAGMLGKPAATCRQLFRRARSRMQHLTPAPQPASRDLDSTLSRVFDALQSGDVNRLAALLADNVTWISDGGPDRRAARRVIKGVDRVSRGMAGLTNRYASEGLWRYTVESVNGVPALLIWEDDVLSTVAQFNVTDGLIDTVWYSRNFDKLRHLVDSLEGSNIRAAN